MASAKITGDGHEIALHRLWTATPTITTPSVFKVGRGTTAATTADTDLETPVPITGEEIVDDAETADWTDSADMTTSLNSTTFRIGSNALNLTKDAGASADANTSKTTTSLDFTSKRLEFFLYINTQATLDLLKTTDCLLVRFGSDASNYYQWTRNKSQLAVGWNYIINMTSANADSTTGTPVLTAMDYTFIQLSTTLAASTWTSGEAIMDDIRLVEVGDLTKTFVSGYPSLDTTNLQSTVRTLILSTEALRHNITEFGLFNTDSVPLMFSRSTFTAVDKDNATQMIFVQKTKMA